MSNVYNKYRRYILLFGAFLIQFTLGHFYTFGNNQVMIVDYMRNYSISKLGVDMENSVWIIGMMYFGLGAAVSFGGYIEMKIGTAKTVLLGSWFMSLNVCLMYFTMKSYLAVVVVTYGLFSGIGIGIAYGVSLAAPVKCFKRNKGLIIGITVSGFGLSPIIFNLFEDYLFMKYEKSYFENLPDMFVISGLIYAILQLLGSMLIITKSKKTGSNPKVQVNKVVQHLIKYEKYSFNVTDTAPPMNGKRLKMLLLKKMMLIGWQKSFFVIKANADKLMEQPWHHSLEIATE